MRRSVLNRAMMLGPRHVASLAGLGLAATLPLANVLAGNEPGDVRADLESARPNGQAGGVAATGAHVPPVKRVQPVTPPPAVPSTVPLPMRKPHDLGTTSSTQRKN